MTNAELVREFHQACGVPVRDTPGLIPPRQMRLRRRLLREETREARRAMRRGSLPEIAKELADGLIVFYGAALEYGIPIDAVVAEVHRSNMTKAGAAKRRDGKVLKGANYQPPDLAPLLGGGR
jgi:predicted HAD superfamily Cof-like phosphohydrolase